MIIVPLGRRLAGNIIRWMGWLVSSATRGRIKINIGLPSKDIPFANLVADHDVVIMKHCFPASDVLEDSGNPDPASEIKSIENYKAVYRLLSTKFDENPDTIFILWTLPPRHGLATNSEQAARATEFSEWLKMDFITEDGSHPNIYIWDFRNILMDPNTNCLKYEYELSHSDPNSHPNMAANNMAGPQLAQFIVESITDFAHSNAMAQSAKIVLLHHSTGLNVYRYQDLGVTGWFKHYNHIHGTRFKISEIWYPLQGNMPAHYYRTWLVD